MQKAIRRGDATLAGYWALELFHSGYGAYVWRRLLTISAEDCWGILTAEIKALQDSYALINMRLPANEPKGRIFISKAVILLAQAKKSRDADHLQNLVYDEQIGLSAEALEQDLREAPEYIPIPDYAYDCHTRVGKNMGKTKRDFFKAEQAALKPHEPGLFDGIVENW